MSDLHSRQCVPCRKGMSGLGEQQQLTLLSELSGWVIEPGPKLTKTYKFSDFSGGLVWVNRLSAVAEEQDHHPDIELQWGKVKVSFWTHAVGGLSENDFILAAKLDALEARRSA